MSVCLALTKGCDGAEILPDGGVDSGGGKVDLGRDAGAFVKEVSKCGCVGVVGEGRGEGVP